MTFEWRVHKVAKWANPTCLALTYLEHYKSVTCAKLNISISPSPLTRWKREGKYTKTTKTRRKEKNKDIFSCALNN